MLEMHHVSYRVRGKALVAGINLQVEPGKVLALVGPNGAGKSTLLKLATGALSPTEGHITLAGKPLASYPSGVLARHRAVLSQQVQLPFPYTVREVVALGRTALAERAATTHRIVEELLHVLELTHLADRAYNRLSGGEQQRTQLARVLAQLWDDGAAPAERYLFLDEPTASLDLKHQHRILALASKVLGPKVALVAVVHDLNLATAYFDEIVFLKGGRCMACGTVTETVSQATVEHVFEQPVTVRPHPVSGRPFVIPHTLTLPDGPLQRAAATNFPEPLTA